MENSASLEEIVALKGAVKYFRNKVIAVDEDNRDLGMEIRDLKAEIVRLQAKKRPAEVSEEDSKHETSLSRDQSV